MNKVRAFSSSCRNKLPLIALTTALVYSFLLLLTVPSVKGQSSQADEAEVEFRQSAGPHSANLAVGYYDRTSDHTPDPLTKTERQIKEQSLSGTFSVWGDPGRVVTGRLHDWNIRIEDTINDPGPMPTGFAKAIITATLKSTHAFVGSDHQSVYSEYYFTALKVFKTDDRRLKPNSELITTRVGGAVLFPSGHQRDYVEEKEGVPKIGSEYALFLWRPAKARRLDYGIDAIYEMRDGKLYALDFVRPFTDFEGKSADDFLAQVAGALSK